MESACTRCAPHLVFIKAEATAAAREMKPTIGKTGDDGTPIRDEILLEMVLQEGEVDDGATTCLR